MNSGSMLEVCHGVRSPDCTCHSHGGFLTRRGYEFVRTPQVDKTEVQLYLDKVGSVSALVEGEGFVFDDQLIDEQALRSLPQGV